MVFTSAGCVMAVNIWVGFLLEPRDGQPSKYESISVHLSCFNTEHALICTHLSPMLTTSYHPISTPFSRSFSKPGVQIRRKRAHICSGLMFECPAFHWCWIVPASEGSRVWRIYVCAYATLKFSVPRSLWVTHGAPMVVSVSFYEEMNDYTYHQMFLSHWDIAHRQTLDSNLSTRLPAREFYLWSHPNHHANADQNAAIYHVDPWPRNGWHLQHKKHAGQGALPSAFWPHLDR